MQLQRGSKIAKNILYSSHSRDIRAWEFDTALELIGHVAIPYKWKEFLFHRICSHTMCTAILKSGLIAGGRESKEGRQNIFFTHPNPFGDDPDEEESSDDPLKTEKSTLSQYVEENSGHRLLGQFSLSTRQRITILADEV